MGSCHPMASITLVCKGSSALVFKLNSRLEKFNCLLITTWVFNRLAKFSISKTVLSSLLPFKINKHKACFLSSPSFTFLRIWHSIYSIAPEKNLRRRYLSSLFSHIWHPTYQVFFRSALINDLEFTTLFKVKVESHLESPAGLFVPTLAPLHNISTQ